MFHLQEFFDLLTARLIDINKHISPACLSAGCEHGFAGKEKHKTVKCTNPKMSIYSLKLKGLLNKQLNKDKLNGIYRMYMKL